MGEVDRYPDLLILDNGLFIDYDPDSREEAACLHHTRPLSPLFIRVEEQTIHAHGSVPSYQNSVGCYRGAVGFRRG